jgi:hypothetical protein
LVATKDLVVLNQGLFEMGVADWLVVLNQGLFEMGVADWLVTCWVLS